MAVSGALASSAAASVRVYVSPSAGRPATAFVVRFRAPRTTGNVGGLHSHYQLYASRRKGRNCSSSISMALGATRAGSMVRARLRPRHAWCVGTFRGRIVEFITNVCGPPQGAIVCPNIVVAPELIGRFSFRVARGKTRRSSSNGGGTGNGQSAGPTFGGLVSATYCAALTPKILPAQKSVLLSWNAATDPATPSSEIVYDIYYSPTAGGEDFSHPSWTTGPGQDNYTATIPQGSTAYFVVRARDQAGLEDHNTVERAAVQSCGAPMGA